MASKMCVSVILLVLSCLLVVVGKGTAAASNEVVVDVHNEEVRYGQDHSFLLLSSGLQPEPILRPYSFRLGTDGSPVLTGTLVILARNNTFMACINGKVEWVEPGLIGPEMIVHVGAGDTAEHLYVLEFPEIRPIPFVTDSRLSTCYPGARAAGFQFQNENNIAAGKAGVAQADTLKSLM